MEQDYLIAGHRIKVENETLMHAMDRMSGFEVFKVNNKDEDTFRFVLVDSEMPAWKEILYSLEPVPTGIYSNLLLQREKHWNYG